MNQRTFIQLLQSGGVALVVAGIAYGFAVGWSPTEGTQAMGVAGTVAFGAMAIGILVAGALRDLGDRPAHAPSAFGAGFGTSLVLMLFASAPIVIVGIAPLVPFLVWLGLHALAQAALAMLVFRRADPDERARRSASRVPSA